MNQKLFDLQEMAQEKSLKDMIAFLRSKINRDPGFAEGALTYIGNMANDFGEYDVRDLARAIRDEQ